MKRRVLRLKEMVVLGGRALGLFAKAIGLYRARGVSGLVRKLRKFLWSGREWIVLRKFIEPVECSGEFDDVVFRVATQEDIPLIAKAGPDDFGLGLQFGERCSKLRVGLSRGEIVTIGVNRAEESELVFTACSCYSLLLWAMFGQKVPEGHTSWSHIWVSPDHRRKGIAVRGMRLLESAVARQGWTCIWAFVFADNEASLCLHDSLGFERYERLSYMRRFGLKYVLFEREGCRRRLSLREPVGLSQ